ncbi:MAG: hypothetical protein OYG31_03270 [Candidatus Kaiserbacteria bacterium]|nr:hypothetical protein [Candidatus Kaiserbacteria bacterium]
MTQNLISTLIFAVVAAAAAHIIPHDVDMLALVVMVALRFVLSFGFPTVSLVRDAVHTVFWALIVVIATDPGMGMSLDPVWFLMATVAVWSLLSYFYPRTPED